MLAGAPLSYWIGFFVVVALVVIGDLALLNRGSGPRRLRGSLAFFVFLLALAGALAIWLAHTRGQQRGLEFASGYLIELSLSIDNLFVFLVMFDTFGLNPQQQKKALTLGVLGSIVMRGLFMLFGIALLDSFAWIEYLFGVFLLIAALRLLRETKRSGRAVPGTHTSRSQRWPNQWMSRLTGRWAGTPTGVLLSAVIAIELVDIVFALDSIPAVLAVTRDPFVAYTSNILAVLGLRSLYFLLAGVLARLRFLRYGLVAILIFVGLKMIGANWVRVPIGLSLGVIVLAVGIAAAASLLVPAAKKTAPQQECE